MLTDVREGQTGMTDWLPEGLPPKLDPHGLSEPGFDPNTEPI